MRSILPIVLLLIAAIVCAVAIFSDPSASAETAGENKPDGPAPDGMVWVPAGQFVMGKDGSGDEGPAHSVKLDGFWMDSKEVTNRQFKKFVTETGYVTTAEKPPVISGIKPGYGAEDMKILPEFNKPGSLGYQEGLGTGDFDKVAGAYSWAKYIIGASWMHPEGPDSSIDDRMEHPVVHVSWDDAMAYCKWAGKSLPTEAQWEYAARGGLKGKTYPWGNERNPEGKWLNNIWQGEFPVENTATDGFPKTAPVGSFPPNDFGLHEMSGNVWEWCSDYYRFDYYSNSPKRNPQGPSDSLDPQEPHLIKRVQRGGSFMCSDSYCVAYRMSARGKGEASSGAFHTGFRCVIVPDKKK